MAARSGDTGGGFYAAELEEIRRGWESVLPGVDAGSFPFFVRIAILANLSGAFVEEVLAPFGLTRAEYETLGILRSTGSGRRCSPTELARFARQTTAGMTKTLDRLERAVEELIRRLTEYLRGHPERGA